MTKALEIAQVPNFFDANTTGIYFSGVVNAASHTIGSSFVANSVAIVSTGYANVTVSVNSALFTVGSNFIANTTGAYHTGTVNAASHTVGSNFIANTTGTYHTGVVNAASHTVGSNFVANTSGITTTGTLTTGSKGINKDSMPAGTVLQVVNVQTGNVTTTTSSIPIDDTIPQNTEGTELFTVSITPTSATSKLLINATVSLSPSAAQWMAIAIFQDSNVNAIAGQFGWQPTATGGYAFPLTCYITAGTTSTTTFKLRYGGSGGTITVNGAAGGRYFGGVNFSSMTITEIAA